MSFNALKIIFRLDGTGIYYDPFEPIMLDSLLAWCLMPFHASGIRPERDDKPFDISLPLAKWKINGSWGWKASALFPEGQTAESLQFWRKRFRTARVEVIKGKPDIRSGAYREYHSPIPLLLTHRMVAYVVGDRRNIRKALQKHLKYLGKKRAYGKGSILGIEVEVIEQDFSLTNKDGLAMRWLPDDAGIRLVRPRPPYWNNCGKIRCCEILERRTII